MYILNGKWMQLLKVLQGNFLKDYLYILIQTTSDYTTQMVWLKYWFVYEWSSQFIKVDEFGLWKKVTFSSTTNHL